MLQFPPAYAASLNALLYVPALDGATVCATVTDDKGNLLFDRNGSTLVLPASNEKLLTAAFALFELGPTYRPQTRIWKLQDRTVVESEGDPSLSYDDLAKAAGSLQLDPSLPVQVKEPYAPEFLEDWEIGDLPNHYAAPVAAFSVDQGGMDLWNHDGVPELRPAAFGVRIVRSGPTTGAPDFTYDPIRRTLTVTGNLPKQTKLWDTLCAPSADEAAAGLLGRRFARVTAVPSDSPTLVLQGEPLSDVLNTCLHQSDNIMAENLLLMAANHEGALPEQPYPTAVTRLREFLNREVGFPLSQFNPQDGSGLGRSNLVTTGNIARLLNWSAAQSTGVLWKASLASTGTGTLSHRLAGIDFRGKTGSLSHVTALSGYLVTRHLQNLTISVIVNNFLCSEGQAHEAIDRFIDLLSERAP